MITKVTKGTGDLFIFQARFGKVNLPLPIPVKWAGDTPIITVTDMGIPGIGKYTARVMIYGDHYAGTWSGSANHQGMLVGRIEHAPTTQPTQAEKH